MGAGSQSDVAEKGAVRASRTFVKYIVEQDRFFPVDSFPQEKWAHDDA